MTTLGMRATTGVVAPPRRCLAPKLPWIGDPQGRLLEQRQYPHLRLEAMMTKQALAAATVVGRYLA
jgi:hypothetical protein